MEIKEKKYYPCLRQKRNKVIWKKNCEEEKRRGLWGGSERTKRGMSCKLDAEFQPFDLLKK